MHFKPAVHNFAMHTETFSKPKRGRNTNSDMPEFASHIRR